MAGGARIIIEAITVRVAESWREGFDSPGSKAQAVGDARPGQEYFNTGHSGERE